MTILQSGAIASTGGGYQIERSLRFNSADSAHLNRTLGTSNRRTFTFSAWLKRSVFASTQCIFGNINYAGGGSTNQQFYLGFTGSDQLDMFHYNNGTQNQVTSSAVYRDPSAWYHIVGAVDTTQATSSNRLKIYVNGSQITALATATYPAQNTDTFINANLSTGIGRQVGTGISGSYYNDGYLTEIYFIDGQALTPSDFGETDSATGVWKPKAYSGTYGTNGFYLKFADNSGTTSTTLGKDSSGNGNNWTPNNFSVTAGAGNDSLVDSPTNYGSDTGAGGEVRGNYATANPLWKGASVTLANGNLDVSATSVGSRQGVIASIFVSSGKWYFEYIQNADSNSNLTVGIADTSFNATNSYVGQTATTYGYTARANTKYNNNTGTSYGTGSSTNGDVLMCAFDLDNGKIYFGKNGTWYGSGDPVAGTNAAFTGISGTYCPAYGHNATASQSTGITFNFGQRAFAYTAPSNFKALCTQNLPTPTIGATSTTQANKYMDVTLYTGNATARSITNSGSMQPDFVWDKLRSGANSHRLFDAVRGVEKALYSNLTNIEATETGTLTAFNSNGFSLGTNNETNTNGSTYVAWQWNAGGSNQTISVGQYATSPANVPSIASTVRANTTSGFSIVTFTTNNTAGATVGHGCQVGGVATTPDMIIMKYRGLAANWVVYHKSMNATPQNGYLNLNTTAGYAALIDPWNNTAPSSTVITMGAGAGSAGSTNYSVYTSVAYCFAAVPGYSAFGSYTGNGSADGPFVYTGFRPRWLLRKRYDTGTTSDWQLIDTAREEYNPDDSPLWPNLSNAQSPDPAFYVDMLSNGFKLRGTTASTNLNASGGTYIYAAFAEHPFKYSLAR